jgi:ElaB/YqjD/DUF883 family membrane-anchored ribosome-binding protein
MQSTPFNTTAPGLGREEDAVPGFASNTPHKTLVSGRKPDTERLKNLASEAVTTARDMARDARAAAVQQADATATWVGNNVRESPMRALGIAIAVGAVIGLLLARR